MLEHKVRIALLAAVFAATFSISSPAWAIAPLKGLVSAKLTNVRKTPAAKGEITMALKSGMEVQIIQRTEDKSWLKIRARNGVDGWVQSSHLQVILPGTPRLTRQVAVEPVDTSLKLKKPGPMLATPEGLLIAELQAPSRLVNWQKDSEISSQPFAWTWLSDKVGKPLLAKDPEGNLYANHLDPLRIEKIGPDQKSVFVTGDGQLSSLISMLWSDGLLYALDPEQKSIKVFDAAGKLDRVIFLTQTQLAKGFAVDTAKNILYVLSWPEEVTTPQSAYFVRADRLNVRSAPDVKSPDLGSASGGSTLTKREWPSDLKPNSDWFPIAWMGKTAYVARSYVQEVTTQGELQQYALNGDFVRSWSLRDAWQNRSPNSFRDASDDRVKREWTDIALGSKGQVLLTLATQKVGSKRSTLWITDLAAQSFRMIPEMIPAPDARPVMSDLGLFWMMENGQVAQFDESGQRLGASPQSLKNPFLSPSYLKMDGSQVLVLDSERGAIARYDTKGSPLGRIAWPHPTSDVCEYGQIVKIANHYLIPAQLQANGFQKGFLILDEEQGAKWYWPLRSQTPGMPKIVPQANGGWLLIGEGKSLRGASFLQLYGADGLLLKQWRDLDDIITDLPKKDAERLTAPGSRLIVTDEPDAFYLLGKQRHGPFSLLRLSWKPDTGLQASMWLDSPLVMPKNAVWHEFPATVLDIRRDRQGYTYVLMTSESKASLTIYTPLGDRWQTLELKERPTSLSLALDAQDYLWLLDPTSLTQYKIES